MKRQSKFSNYKVDSSGVRYVVIPKAKRIKIYKKILSELSLNVNNGGLCILLAHKAGLRFIDSPDSDCLYPEFGNYITKYRPTQYIDLFNHDRHKWRKTVIEGCIKDCLNGKA
jgi:hypothetical protein